MPRLSFFDDISKGAKDVLNDNYFEGSKLTMKMKHVDGVNVTAEARLSNGKPVVNKISSDFRPCDCCNVKKLSIDTNGMIVGDLDVKDVVKDTTFTVRTLKDYNEAGVKKAAVGAKVMTDSVAVDTAFDIPSQRYYASLVYGYKDLMVGSKVYGDLSNSPSADVAVSYAYKNMVYSCTGYDLFKKADLAVMYDYDKNTRFSAICRVSSLNDMPEFDLGVVRKMAKDAEARCKVSSAGEVSACFKVTVEKKVAFTGSLTVDAANLSNGNHRTGAGIEFIFLGV